MVDNISVVMPAYNEQDSILETIKGLSKIKEIDEIIIVDDGSTDNTPAILSDISGIRLVTNGKNKGKGYAVHMGIQYAKNDFILLVDADLGDSSEEVSKMISCMGKNRLIIGALSKSTNRNGFGVTKRVSVKGFEMLTKETVESVLSGQRLLPADFMRSIDLPRDYALEFKITLEAVRSGMEIIEVPVQMHHREYGRTFRGFLHRGKQCSQILKQIAKEVADAKIHNRIYH